MASQVAHQNDDALAHGVVAGGVGGGGQEVLKHRQQQVDVLLQSQ